MKVRNGNNGLGLMTDELERFRAENMEEDEEKNDEVKQRRKKKDDGKSFHDVCRRRSVWKDDRSSSR